MRQFQPFFTVSLPVFAIRKRTEKALLIQYKKDTPEKDYVWIPRGWLYNISYKNKRNSIGEIISSKATLVFYGFLETELKMKMSHLMKKPKKKK